MVNNNRTVVQLTFSKSSNLETDKYATRIY